MRSIEMFKQLFFRQLIEDSCGIACLAMVLNYEGRYSEALRLSLNSVKPGGMSLHEIQLLAIQNRLPCRCVEMDIDFLKTLNTPVILHTVNEIGLTHFQVYFLHTKKGFIMADPATQVHYLSENELSEKWQSGGAIFFEGLKFSKQPDACSLILLLLKQMSYPPGLFFVIPLLTLFVTSFGVALTWLLQKGLTDALIFKQHVIYSLLLLLFFICLFRNLFTYVRQYILILLNLNTNSKLMNSLVEIFPADISEQEVLKNEVAYSFGNLQKIQNALSSFISVVLSDGFLVALMLISVLYLLPLAGLVNISYVLLLIIWQLKVLPRFLYQTSKTRLLSKISETAFLRLKQNTKRNDIPEMQSSFKSLYELNLSAAKKFAVNLSGNYLAIECCGTANLILVLLFAIWRYENEAVDYQSLMLAAIETYFITMLMQRICTSFQQLGEGVDACIAQFR